MNDKIQELQRQIQLEQSKINNCRHEFNEPVRDDEVKREPSDHEMVAQGSDVWYRPTGYRDVTVKRWSRKCKKCGYKEYTYDTEPVVTSHKPKF